MSSSPCAAGSLLLAYRSSAFSFDPDELGSSLLGADRAVYSVENKASRTISLERPPVTAVEQFRLSGSAVSAVLRRRRNIGLNRAAVNPSPGSTDRMDRPDPKPFRTTTQTANWAHLMNNNWSPAIHRTAVTCRCTSSVHHASMAHRNDMENCFRFNPLMHKVAKMVT